MTGCKVSSFPQKLLMTLQTHIESTSTSERIRITSAAYNPKHSMWSLLTSALSASTLEQHVQVVGSKERERSNPACSARSNLWYKTNNYQHSGEWTTNALSITQFRVPARCPQDSQSSVIFCNVFGNVSSLSTCSQMRLGFALCDTKVAFISEWTQKKDSEVVEVQLKYSLSPIGKDVAEIKLGAKHSILSGYHQTNSTQTQRKNG